MKWRNRLFGFLILALCGCTKHVALPTTPQGALENYVRTAFNARTADDRNALLELSTGDAKAWLESMSAEDFKKQFVDNSMVFGSIKTQDLRTEKSGDTSLVYELSFRDGKTPNAAAYTNKKIAYLTRDDKGNWKVKATKNIKSFVERKDPLEVLAPEPGEQGGEKK